MRILEEFWHGNIEPTEYDSSKEYKKLLELICRNEEKLQATMTDEQKELFEKYTDCVREYQTITDCLLFQNSFMSGLEADTIGGFNSMIEKQKKADGEALVSTVLFDNTSEVIHDRVSVQNIKPMTDEDYMVRGCTALLDAIGGAIHHIGNVHKYARAEDVPEHTMFVITTDGMENASRQ